MENSVMGENELKIVADLVYKTSGIVFKDSNLTVLQSRLSTKLREKSLGLPEYLAVLQKDKQELLSFIDFVTTNFTSFFRNPRQFECMVENALPEVVKRNADTRQIRLWSAACSTGEEPYTMAMVVDRYLKEKGLAADGWDFHIIGSDISLESLFIAKEGRFPIKSIQKVEEPYAKYFRVTGEDCVIADEVKKKVQFDYHNLIYDNGIRDMDIAFCRNVLIYFDEDIQKKVVDNIHIGTKPGAFLFIGHSESLIGICDNFKATSFEKGIIYVRQ